MVSRNFQADYQESADLVWLQTATALGISVERSTEVYASWDGRETLTLASAEFLDPDDCLAQMIFHEICHLLVSGEESRRLLDWGLDNTTPKDRVYEHATNRLQAALAGAYGLRQFMAVTTSWRAYYDSLPRDPLAGTEDPAISLAKAGLERAINHPYRSVLHAALDSTAMLGNAIRAWVPDNSLWHGTLGEHPFGFRMHPDPGLRCETCAWAIVAPERKIGCRKTRPGCRPVSYRLLNDAIEDDSVRVGLDQTACEHFESRLAREDCFSCGACCHKGFDVVDVAANEPFATRYPELVEVRDIDRCVVPRPGGHCVALAGTGSTEQPYLCRYYDARPRSCRDFELAGDACLVARQRAGVFTGIKV